MRIILRLLLRNRRVMWLLKRLYGHFHDDIVQALNDNPEIAEINPLRIRRSELDGLRFNLLIPAVSERHIFGGIATGLQFFRGFEGLTSDLRIIATDEGKLREARLDAARFAGWEFVDAADDDRPGRLMVATGRRKAPLAVRANDVFISTAWWSAHLARELLADQAALHGMTTRRFIYLIQDYEPLFHPWAARYALAKQTYVDRNGYVPVFNTALLRDYLVMQGLAERDDLFFHPIMNDSLQAAAARLGPQPREKRILVYGRPSVDRNAYPLLVRGLRRLVERHDTRGWQFVSAGEPHAPAQLGPGVSLEPLGKLALEDYARELLRCHAGVSLMISPHPSYPPLEMAALGMHVITNGYANKDLSSWAPAMRSINVADPDALADAVHHAMQRFGEAPAAGPYDPAFASYLEANDDFSALAASAWERARAER